MDLQLKGRRPVVTGANLRIDGGSTAVV